MTNYEVQSKNDSVLRAFLVATVTVTLGHNHLFIRTKVARCATELLVHRAAYKQFLSQKAQTPSLRNDARALALRKPCRDGAVREVGVHGVSLAASFLNPKVLREVECKRKHKGVNLCVWSHLVDLFKIIYQL